MSRNRFGKWLVKHPKIAVPYFLLLLAILPVAALVVGIAVGLWKGLIVFVSVLTHYPSEVAKTVWGNLREVLEEKVDERY
jgi:ABC-type methionine transport system permease subunit